MKQGLVGEQHIEKVSLLLCCCAVVYVHAVDRNEAGGETTQGKKGWSLTENL